MSLAKNVAVLLLATLLMEVLGHVIDTEKFRSNGMANQSGEANAQSVRFEKMICEWNSICGWAIYDRFTRDGQYFMPNVDCECSNTTTCQKDDDDISIPALVFRCRPPIKENSTTTKNKNS